MMNSSPYRSQDSVVSTVTERYEFKFQQGQEFSLLHILQTASEVHPTSSPMGTGGALSPEVKWLECEADHSPPNSDEAKKMWIYTSTPPYAFMM
jgi:hypothetical protein